MSVRIVASSIAYGFAALLMSAPAANAEEFASASPTPVSTGIITPAFVDGLRQELLQPFQLARADHCPAGAEAARTAGSSRFVST